MSNLKPSNDVVSWPVQGRLWEAPATVKAVKGCPKPIVGNFNARTPSGRNYQELAGAPQGIDPATICPPDQTSGKLYFDVIGENPDGVVYRPDGQDQLIWTQ